MVGTPGTDVARSVTAAYTVPAGSFLSSFDTVIADAVALGGYVVRSATAPNSKGRIVSGSVTVAIPTAQMASLLNSLPSDFTASSINFASVDDTSDIVDLNARLTSAQAHLTALQGLLAKATSLDDITTLEQQIEDVETSIDTDQGQLTTLDQAVTYASATVRLTERGAVTVKAATGPSVSSGVSKGWNNLLAIAAVAVEVLVTAIPALILLIIGWAVGGAGGTARPRGPRRRHSRGRDRSRRAGTRCTGPAWPAGRQPGRRETAGARRRAADPPYCG